MIEYEDVPDTGLADGTYRWLAHVMNHLKAALSEIPDGQAPYLRHALEDLLSVVRGDDDGPRPTA